MCCNDADFVIVDLLPIRISDVNISTVYVKCLDKERKMLWMLNQGSYWQARAPG